MIKSEILDQIKVAIELSPSLRHFALAEENRAFKKDLMRCLDDLVYDLRIPAEISLTITPGEDRNRFSLCSYQVSINDRKCRVQVPTIIPGDVHALELANSIAYEILQNRELLLTPRLSEKIQEKWIIDGMASMERFHEILFELVRRGLRIDRAKDIALKEQSEQNFEKSFEEIFYNLDSIAVKVFLSNAQNVKTQSAADDMSFEGLLDVLQEGLFNELGIIIPKVSIDMDEILEENDFIIQLNDVRFPPITGLEHDQFLVNDTVERLPLINIKGKKVIIPASGTENAIVQNKEHELEICKKAGLTTWGSGGFTVLNLAAELRKNAALFLTVETVKYSLKKLKSSSPAFPALVDAASEHHDIIRLTLILRDLLDEQLSIKDLRGILENLLAISGITDIDQSKYVVFSPHTANLCSVQEGKKMEDLNIIDYSNCLRMSLKRYISNKYTRGSSALYVFPLDPGIEMRIKSIVEQPLTDTEREKLIKAIYEAIKNLPAATTNPVILTSVEIRKRLRNLIEKEFPRIAVLCYQELLPDLNTQPIARISWD
ncbi:MAG: FHIPEP family type III secretion protein [Candidatus Methanoperedens sp.]|nr:FHIPEP family type III secretion protein [Candidatus Methanoperedens sp.]